MQSAKNFSGSIVDNFGHEQTVRYAAWATLATGVFNLCVVPVLGFVGFVGTNMATGIDRLADATRDANPGLSAEASASASELASLGFLSGGLAIVSALTAVALIIISVGLFRRAGWGRSGFIVVGSVQVVVSLLFLFYGGDLFQLLWAGLIGFFVFVMATNDGVKRVFGANTSRR